MMNFTVNSLSEYIGQEQAKSVLIPAIQAAARGKQLDNICLYGPAGTGKTTLARLLASALGTKCVKVEARNLKKIDDFTSIIFSLRENDILFVDEIHGLDKKFEELIYSAITEHSMDILVHRKTIHVLTPNFVLVGATTKLGDLSGPLKTRFGLLIELTPYTTQDLTKIILNKATSNDIFLTQEAAWEIARRARGTARIAENLLSIIQNYSLAENRPFIGKAFVDSVMEKVGIDSQGMTKKDIAFIKALRDNFKDKPASLSSVAAVLNDSENNLLETIEPFLIQSGLIMRSSRGRMLTEKGRSLAV